MSTNICKNNIKCAVFDLDGTLLNTINTITHYLNFALEKNGLAAVSADECKTFVGDGVRMLLIRAIESRGEYTDELYERIFTDYNSAYDQNPNYLTEPYEGIGEMLSELRAAGLKLAVLSNKPHIATVGTIEATLPDIFDIVNGGKAGVPLKPDPTTLLETIAELGCTPDECAYIGDSDVDVLTGRRAGVALTVGVSWGYRSRKSLDAAGADAIADTADELFSLIFTKNT